MRGEGRIFLRGRVYWVAFYLRGVEQRESADTEDEQEARKYLKRRIREVGADLIGARKFTPARSRRITIGELIEALRENYRVRDKLSPQSDSHLDRAKEDWGKMRALDLTPEQYERYVAERLEKHDAPAFINRTTQLLNQAYSLAITRRHFNRDDVPTLTCLPVSNTRLNFIGDEEFKKLLAVLPNDGLRDFVEWLGASGMRKGEASLLCWSMVQGDELRIPGDICKNGYSRTLPLTDELATIIERRKAARSVEHEDGSTTLCEYVFHRDGRRIELFRKSWASACKKAGIPDAHVHDLRRSAARRLLKAGVNPLLACKVTGHKTTSMFARYAIIETDDIREALDQAAEYRKAEEKKAVEAAAKKAAEKAKVVSM
jgi:integrase